MPPSPSTSGAVPLRIASPKSWYSMAKCLASTAIPGSGASAGGSYSTPPLPKKRSVISLSSNCGRIDRISFPFSSVLRDAARQDCRYGLRGRTQPPNDHGHSVPNLDCRAHHRHTRVELQPLMPLCTRNDGILTGRFDGLRVSFGAFSVGD